MTISGRVSPSALADQLIPRIALRIGISTAATRVHADDQFLGANANTRRKTQEKEEQDRLGVIWRR